MTAKHRIAPLAKRDIEKAGAVLARAFLNNQLNTYLFPEDEERERSNAILFSAFMRYGFLAGVALATDTVEGVSVWLPPNAPEMDAEVMSQAGIDRLPAQLGEEANGRLIKFFGR